MKISHFCFVLLCLLACTGIAIADTGMPQVPETQGISSVTSIDGIGTMSETDNLAWSMVSCGICGFEAATIPFAHAQYAVSYGETTLGIQGDTTYAKSMRIDTASRVADQFNVVPSKFVTFQAIDAGRMTSDENIVLDGIAGGFPTEISLICPFGNSEDTAIPPFCNIVKEGSSLDLAQGSFATSAAERHVMPAVPVTEDEGIVFAAPVGDAGVALDYQVTLTGIGNDVASGSAKAFMNAHIQEARNDLGIQFSPSDPAGADKSEDLTYAETSTASGAISIFQKSMSYQSKVTGSGVPLPGIG